MRAALWSIVLCAGSTLAAPSTKQEKRQDVSTDGSCGNGGATCLGSFFGDCCSEAGHCGSTNIYCGQGCQSGYGNCTDMVNGLLISNDGTCGNGVTCQGSIYGDCCSSYGYCGSTDDYCSASCDSKFGLCGSASTATSSSSLTTPYANGTSTTSSALAATTTNPTCPSSNGTIYVAASLNEYEIECGLDRPGNDLKSVQVYSNTISGCIAQCEATTGCVDIIMSGTTCYMKKAIGKASKSANVRGARLFKRGAGVSNKASTTSSASATSSASSSASSAATAPVTSSSIVPSGSSISTSTGTAAIPISTNPTCPSSNATEFIATSGATYLIECYVDRTGNDIKSVDVYSNRIADCINRCDATSGCVDISMSGTTCYMKSKAGNPSTNKQVRGARKIADAPISSSSSSVASSTASSSSSVVVPAAPSASANSTSSVPAGTGSSVVSSSSSSVIISAIPSASANSTSSVPYSTSSTTLSASTYFSASGTPIVSANSTSSFSLSTSTVILSTGVSTSSSMPLSTGASSYVSSTNTESSPYGNGTSSIVVVGPTGTGVTYVPLSTGVSSSTIVVINSTSSGVISISSNSSTVTAPLVTGTGASSGVFSASSTKISPYGNGTTSTVVIGPTGTGFSSSVPLSSSTIVVVNSTSSGVLSVNSTSSTVSVHLTGTAPLATGTGASSGVASVSSTESSPYGNGTTSSVVIGPTGTGVTSIPLSTGVSSSTIVIVNSTSSAVLSVNSTSSTVTAPLTTAPVTIGTGASSGIVSSTSSGIYTNATTALNSTASASSTTSYAFDYAGGVPSGHPVVSNTSACTTKPTSTAACVRCEGQPGDDQWCGYKVTDNSYNVMPKTCNDPVVVDLEVSECEVSPLGVKRSALCVNGQTPGPLIEANWGDTIVVRVTNSMSYNGTSMHWHGMRQNYTNEMDGVVAVTQCALAPGQSQTYTFKATNYGFSWYHSHLTLQAYEGLFGPMWIHGPQTQDADVNAGELIITDWSSTTVDSMYYEAEINGVRTMDTGIINGMNVDGDDGSSNQTGTRYTVPTEFVPGQSYMFNLLNAAIQSTYKFYIDGHNFTVISADYVPIVPYETNVLSINIGQRYQIIVTANQAVGDYWLRFDNQNACATTTNADNIKGIIHYQGSAGGLPNSTAQTYPRKYAGGAILGTCEDEPLASLVPVAPMNVGEVTQTVEHSLVVSNSNPKNLYRWYLDGTTFQSSWSDATLYDIYNNDTVPDYSGNLAIEVPNLGEWVYIIIESAVPLGHPIHLHGHDFHVLASGYGSYDSSVELNLVNPPRRDVAFMPGDGPTGQGGYLVLAFFTDNPGVWLMHCHIGWHVAMGFALQFIEAKEQIKDTVTDSCMLNDVCTDWRSWTTEKGITTDDSGV